MTADEIRQKFIEFYKTRGHAEIPSAPLVPENDPTTLFTSSGMQPLVPYLLGEKHPLGTRLVNSQKCFRAQDIEEVGDNRHTTFFEMLGNWSLGDYFKKEQLPWFLEFLTKELSLPVEKLAVTVFEGNSEIPKDVESEKIWLSLGIPKERIFYYGVDNNWWSRSGMPDSMPPGEPGGPDSEVFFEFTQVNHNKKFGHVCHPNCNCGRFMEIGNIVFMEYKKQSDGSFTALPKKNVDFGGGLERLVAAVANNPDIFQTDLFLPVIKLLESESNKKYHRDIPDTTAMRIIADHIRASVMIIVDGVIPSNKLQGSVLRRLVSRAIIEGNKLNVSTNIVQSVASEFISIYQDTFPEVKKKRDEIFNILNEEDGRVREKIEKGSKELVSNYQKYFPLTDETSNALIVQNIKQHKIDYQEFLSKISGANTSLPSVAAGTIAFNSQASYGLPVETSKNLILDKSGIKNIDEKIWNETIEVETDLHKNLSRKTSLGIFRGGLADHSEQVIKLHTATHLVHQALRTILGNHIQQKGSNITVERLRFDFSHPTKLTSEEIKRIEELVNQKIREDLPVSFRIVAYNEAISQRALAFFGERYPGKVKVYTIGQFSKEICGGPHVEHTGVLGIFKITREEALGAGTRRLYAVVT